MGQNTGETATHYRDVACDLNNPLDALQQQIIQDILTPEGKLVHLYGHPYVPEKTLEVYTNGSCHGNGTEDARAGSGVF